MSVFPTLLFLMLTLYMTQNNDQTQETITGTILYIRPDSDLTNFSNNMYLFFHSRIAPGVLLSFTSLATWKILHL
jgi:hypothetical protein